MASKSAWVGIECERHNEIVDINIPKCVNLREYATRQDHGDDEINARTNTLTHTMSWYVLSEGPPPEMLPLCTHRFDSS